jgi:hypothetical protein
VKYSEGSIGELATALAKAQGAMKGAEKDSKNPHLSNKYASLSAIIEAARKPLSDNGLSWTQLIGQTEGGVILETVLLHSSGQWLSSEQPVTITVLSNKGINEAQALGSGLTYFKRYALAAMLGISIADEDDDGNAAQVQVGRQQVRRPEPQAKPTDTNGKSKAPSTAAELLALVNSKVKHAYQNEPELFEAIVSALGDNFTWPKPEDTDGWRAAFKAAKEAAEKRAEHDELGFMEEPVEA